MRTIYIVNMLTNNKISIKISIKNAEKFNRLNSLLVFVIIMSANSGLKLYKVWFTRLSVD